MFQKADSLGSTEYAYCASHRIAVCYHKLGKTQEAIEWLNKSAALKK